MYPSIKEPNCIHPVGEPVGQPSSACIICKDTIYKPWSEKWDKFIEENPEHSLTKAALKWRAE